MLPCVSCKTEDDVCGQTITDPYPLSRTASPLQNGEGKSLIVSEFTFCVWVLMRLLCVGFGRGKPTCRVVNESPHTT